MNDTEILKELKRLTENNLFVKPKKKGRPFKSIIDKKSVCIAVRVTKHDYMQLQNFCKANKTTVSGIIYDFIKEVLDSANL